jgi:hypothetical protein
MTDDQWFILARVLFYVLIGIVLIVAVLSFLAYDRVTHGARLRELLLIWIVAVGGSVVGSIISGILVFYLYGVQHPEESYGAHLAAGLGMIVSIPVGGVGGGLAGTMLAALLVYLNTRRPTLIASIGALVVAALVSGVALVPIGLIVFGIEHI